MSGRRLDSIRVFVVVLAALSFAVPARAEECEGQQFNSTFELIQKAVFERSGCSASVCHGSTASGGLNLSPEVAYDNLVSVPAQTVTQGGLQRVYPGRKDKSLLFINLAAKTDPQSWTAPLRAMPLDPVPAISDDELEAIRLWIESGAPRDGVVDGTAELLDACLPPPKPLEIEPLPPPAPGTGVQIPMPRLWVDANHEQEVCFASYYNVCDQIPEKYRGPDGDTFRYNLNEVRQDPLSHHLIVNLYQGAASPDDPSWGTYRCRGGAKDGQVCPPTDLDYCGSDSTGCATDARAGVACTLFGPSDNATGVQSSGFSGAQKTAVEFRYPPGVYGELPCSGTIMWNSHAFNLTDERGKLEAWLNFTFVEPEDQLYPARRIFNTRKIFGTVAPAFDTDEPCNNHELPRHARVYELSSHGHKRMKRWRTFLGAWKCAGGPADGQACSPMGYDLGSTDVCQGAPCQATERQPAGDCNYNDEVVVNELVKSVAIALGNEPVSECADADIDGNGAVAVNELVTGVNSALDGVPARTPRAPHESLLYVSTIYNDPIILRYEPTMDFPYRNAADRTFTYCALYDNGFTNPAEVKTKSGSPSPPIALPLLGGPCSTPTHCTAGKVTQPCSGSTPDELNASCDSSAGAGDGVCDACTLRGGVTTEDEMFILMGQYYVP